MKKSTILIIVLVILLIISFGTIMYLNKQLNEQKDKKVSISDAQNFKEEYEKLNNVQNSIGEIYNEVSIDKENPIVYVTLEKLSNIIDSEEEAYIYISSSTCPYCRTTVETLLKVAKDLNIKKIYYYDGFKQESSEESTKILTYIEEKGVDLIDSNGQKRWGIPLVLKIKNGQVISKVRGATYQLNEGQSKYDSLTEEQKKQVYDRYYEELTKESN